MSRHIAQGRLSAGLVRSQLSYDGQHWSSIAWTGGDPTGAWNGDGFLVMPHGVLLAGSYGAAS